MQQMASGARHLWAVPACDLVVRRQDPCKRRVFNTGQHVTRKAQLLAALLHVDSECAGVRNGAWSYRAEGMAVKVHIVDGIDVAEAPNL